MDAKESGGIADGLGGGEDVVFVGAVAVAFRGVAVLEELDACDAGVEGCEVEEDVVVELLMLGEGL